MKSNELKLGHAYKLAGKEGPAFYVNCHPHDGAAHVMAWHNTEEDEEEFFIVDACEIEYEIPGSTELLVFTEQYEMFLLAGRVLQKMSTVLNKVRSIATITERVQKANTSQGDRTWHVLETINDRVRDLLAMLEADDFDAMTGAEKREAEMVELRRKANEFDRITKVASETGEDVQTRVFQEWLNDRRDQDVSSVFHEIVSRFRAK